MENDRNIDTNMYMYMYIYVCISIYLSISLSLYQEIDLSIYLSIYLSILNGSFCHWRVAELRLSNVQLQLPAREYSAMKDLPVLKSPFHMSDKFAGWWFEPLWKIWKSVGIMTFPLYGKS